MDFLKDLISPVAALAGLGAFIYLAIAAHDRLSTHPRPGEIKAGAFRIVQKSRPKFRRGSGAPGRGLNVPF